MNAGESPEMAARLAQAEQERDEARETKQKLHRRTQEAESERDNCMKLALKHQTCENRILLAEARLRECEEALDKLVPDVRLLVIAYYSGAPDDLEAADAPASRLDALLFDDDGAPRSVLPSARE